MIISSLQLKYQPPQPFFRCGHFRAHPLYAAHHPLQSCASAVLFGVLTLAVTLQLA